MGHLQRTDDARPKKIQQAHLHQKLRKGRPKARWKDDVENDIKNIGIVNWRQVTQDRDGWRRAKRRSLYFLDNGATEEDLLSKYNLITHVN
jgi:hypothetical protein